MTCQINDFLMDKMNHYATYTISDLTADQIFLQRMLEGHHPRYHVERPSWKTCGCTLRLTMDVHAIGGIAAESREMPKQQER